MQTISITGENYLGHWTHTRTACRGIVLKDDKILMSYETKTDQWMIPGGGLEAGETEEACCIREIAEETGIAVEPVKCYLEIDEYYEDWKWVNRYYLCRAVGTARISLTEREKAVGMEPRWAETDAIRQIFAGHASYAAADEMRRGKYLREYTALCRLEDAGEANEYRKK